MNGHQRDNIKKSNAKKQKPRLAIKIILVSVLCLVGIFFLLFFPIRYLTSSEYFKIKDSDYFTPLDKGIQQDKRPYLTGLTGQNIFKVIFKSNLQKEAQRLQRMYPDYKRVILRSVLPDKIMVDFIPRQAVALLRLSDDFYTDEEGILFHPIGQEYNNLQLPLIIGLSSRIPDPHSGVKYNEASLQAILEFINNLNKDEDLANQLKIKKINLANINDVFLSITTGCRINLGGIGSLNKNLLILQRLISEINSDLTKVEYIELRFRKPIVKYK